MFRIANHTFEGAINFCALNSGKGIAVVVPADTSSSVMEDLKNATLIEVLDTENEVIGSYRLTGWRKMETVVNEGVSGMMITWSTVNLDELDTLKDEMTALQAENAQLQSDNEDLTAAILELAAIIGGDGEE